PFMFLDPARARSIQGPATMDGIGPTRGWEIYWMEVDVKRRRGAPWAAPVPGEISDKIRHLTSLEFSAACLVHLAPLFAGRGRRAAPGEGLSPRTSMSREPLTPTLSPQARGERETRE